MKKIISFLTVFCIMVPLCISAVGAVSVEEATATVEVLNYSRYFLDEDAEKLRDCVNATAPSADGDIIPLDCTVTIRDVDKNASSMYSLGEHTYAITVSAQQKQTSNSGDSNKNGVMASATITMIWTDVFGTANTIDHLSGGVTITKGTFDHARVSYGSTHNSPLILPYFQADTSFDRDVSFTSTNPFGSLHAHYECWFDELGSTTPLRVCVSTPIIN